LIDLENVDNDTVATVLGQSKLQVQRLRGMPDVPTHKLDLPRLAVFQTWVSTQNAGWVRFSLDDAGVPYTLISKDDIRRGKLRDQFDVILVPHLWSSTKLGSIVGGIDPKWSPLAYTTTKETPNIGHILSSPDITGGIGFSGMAEIEKFVQEGGTLVTLGSAGAIASDSGLVRGIVKRSAGSLNTPGSILTAKVTDMSSPLTYGYDELTHVFRGNGPIFSVPYYDRHYSPLQFGTKKVEGKDDEEAGDPGGEVNNDPGDDAESGPKPPLVISGGIIRGADVIDGEPAIVSKKVGEGRVVLFSWNPMHRHVNHHDHAFVYNAILNWNDL